ncbi:MAG: VOC family protein [Variovorax sp.]|nr:MAG: VOC family protein [Variovorax sp.]
MKNVVNWFEIPVADIDRAQAFYEKVFAFRLRREEMGGGALAVFPYDEPATGGCLQSGANRTAAAGAGIRVYLDCSPSLDAVLGRIESAGGSIVSPRFTLPGDMGVIAHMRDSEGNEVGLHAPA